ncbi:hypothetical protein [uncultured Desulfovibrio sp.]|uniref:hypothetical protein n=1 Tax=uncultured Desulfovibrio sp. TaxID=167968 RepID=UPI0026339CCA|nr:hypothetical protein [uncultured Desulfovibrio sp.]
MAVASSTAALLGAAVTLAGTAVGAWSAVSRQEEQRKQAEFAADMARRNSRIAEENARMAEDEARQTRADSHDQAVRKRQETALLLGRQRAQAGASGAQIDSGSHLDSLLDLREKGELDALALEEQGERAAYNQEVQAWNQRNAAQGSQARERRLREKAATDYLGLGRTLLNSAGRLGNNFDLFSGQGPRLP